MARSEFPDNDLQNHTPSNWTLVKCQCGETDRSPVRAIWEYNPRPKLSVRVVPHPNRKSDISRYCVKISGVLGTKQYTAQNPGFRPHADVAEQVMRGVDGVTSDQIRARLDLPVAVTGTLAERIRTWDDLIAFHDDSDGDLTWIDGIGAATNESISTAVQVGVFNHDPVEVARNRNESNDEKHAVYVLVPTLHEADLGWRVRKEWRNATEDSVLSTVMLPTESPVGDPFPDREAAKTFAQESAAERTNEDSDGDEVSVRTAEPECDGQQMLPYKTSEHRQRSTGEGEN